MNLRPLGYEPSELPNCSTPRCLFRISGFRDGCFAATSTSSAAGRGDGVLHGLLHPLVRLGGGDQVTVGVGLRAVGEGRICSSMLCAQYWAENMT